MSQQNDVDHEKLCQSEIDQSNASQCGYWQRCNFSAVKITNCELADESIIILGGLILSKDLYFPPEG